MMVLKDKDILTSIVRVKGSLMYDVMPVKSSKPIDKSLWIECSKALSRIHVGPPMHIGDVVCKNILNTGVDIVCTKNIPRNPI
jgi:CxxC motif-containing protein